jgi:hypothetical protein
MPSDGAYENRTFSSERYTEVLERHRKRVYGCLDLPRKKIARKGLKFFCLIPIYELRSPKGTAGVSGLMAEAKN